MSMRVGELVSQLRSKSRVKITRMDDVELLADGDQAGQLRVGDQFFPWGDRNTQTVAKFLGGPGYKYYIREPLEWQRAVVRHHTDKMADLEATFYIEGANIAGIYYQEDKIIPLVRVAEQVAEVFDQDDLANVLWAPDQVEINVTSDRKSIIVPGIEGVADRPLEGVLETRDGRRVGDLTTGGVRIIIEPQHPEHAPYVEEFWERLVCLNGMTRRISGSQIKLRGKTVDEILEEMNRVMRQIWEGLDSSGQAILHSAETSIPGTVPDFIRVVAGERGINAVTVLRLQERALTLRPDPSVYDVTQIITALANEDGMSAKARRSLQAIGGDLTVDTERMVHRCNTCERPLAAV
jgi:hypothetical protein